MRIIPSFEKNSSIVEFGTTLAGKIVLLLLFFCLMQSIYDIWMAFELTVFVSLATFWPTYRRVALMVAAQFLLIQFLMRPESPSGLGIELSLSSSPEMFHVKVLAGAAALSIFTLLCFWASRRPSTPFLKYPITTKFVLGFALLILLQYALKQSLIKFFCVYLLFFVNLFFWGFVYWLRDCKKNGQSFRYGTAGFFQYGLPILTTVPLAKGPLHLSAIEAKNADELSRIQIRAVKLALWVIVLSLFETLYSRVFLSGAYTPIVDDFFKLPPGFGIPALSTIIERFLATKNDPLWLCWAAVFNSSFIFILRLAILTHPIIAVLRMFGFSAARNVCAPLWSATLADYWNRVYYYFKELLVDFYFYPTYLRYFKKHPRIRMIFATFAAAGFGNFIWHFMGSSTQATRMGLMNYVIGNQTYAVYCIILAISIGVSQMRAMGKPKVKPNLLRCSSVFFYYSLIGVIAWPNLIYRLTDYFHFYERLFGLR